MMNGKPIFSEKRRRQNSNCKKVFFGILEAKEKLKSLSVYFLNKFVLVWFFLVPFHETFVLVNTIEENPWLQRVKWKNLVEKKYKEMGFIQKLNKIAWILKCKLKKHYKYQY